MGMGMPMGTEEVQKSKKKSPTKYISFFSKKIISDSDDSIIIIIGGLGDDAHTVVKG